MTRPGVATQIVNGEGARVTIACASSGSERLWYGASGCGDPVVTSRCDVPELVIQQGCQGCGLIELVRNFDLVSDVAACFRNRNGVRERSTCASTDLLVDTELPCKGV